MIEVVVLWLYNEFGELLMAQRAHDKRQDPGVWGPSVTGKVEPGETFDEALVREVEEELSLSRTMYQPSKLFQVEFDHPDKEKRLFIIYFARWPKNDTHLVRFDPVEVAGVEWYSIDQITRWIETKPDELVPSASAVWPDTFNALGRQVTD